MNNLLSLSIDINAIGWCITHSKSGKIKDMGVHVFPMGCENYGSGGREVSLKTARSIRRIHRVRYARKRERKIKVLSILAAHQLCPVDTAVLKSWTKSKNIPEKLKKWMDLDPYTLRMQGLHSALEIEEVGRILYHYAQRRGFPFGEKGEYSDSNILLKGMPNYNRPGVHAMERESEANFLIEALLPILPQQKASYQTSHERVRNRFLSRSAYRNEAHAIWDTQAQYHKQKLTPELKLLLIGESASENPHSGAVFYQRPLKSQKYRVGKCLYEPQKTKCCVSSLLYQELLAYKWTNTIKKNGLPLNEKERERVVRYFLKHRKFQFYDIRRLLNPATAHYNKKDDEIIVGSFIFSELSKHYYFGNQWFDFPSQQQEDIWHALYFYNDKDRLVALAEKQWGFATPQALKIANIKLDKRYAPLSKKATRNILYFLKRGIGYDYAVVLAGVKNALGKKWDLVAESDVNYVISAILKRYEQNAQSGFIPALQEFLKEEMQLTHFQIKKMYGPAAHMVPTDVVQKIPITAAVNKEIEDFKKPLLITSLFQLRKLVNALIEQHGPMEKIRIDVNSNLRINKFQRYLQRVDNKRLSAYRKSTIKILGDRAENITPMNILKYQLWEECKQTCPYSGADISLDQLFSDEVAIVYIFPWERSLNDEDSNKALCVSSLAEQIKGYTPYEFFMEHRPYMWEEVVARAARLFSNTATHPGSYAKFRAFVKKHYRKGGLKAPFIDQSFFAKELECFVNKVCQDVQILPTLPVSFFLELWRLQPLIPLPQPNEGCDDFRSYALRAFVLASVNEENMIALGKRNKYEKNSFTSFPEPYAGFRDDVELRIHAIYVSHYKNHRVISKRKLKHFFKGKKRVNLSVAVRGTLHKESSYGKHLHPDGTTAFHIRKPLTSILTQHQVEKVVDPMVRKQLEACILKAGGYREGKVPPQCFFEKSKEGYLTPKVFMPNYRGGDPVPIHKVRIREMMQGAVALHSGMNQYVNLRNNHHIVIYKNNAGDYCEKVVNFWEAVQRCVSKEKLYQLPTDGHQLICTLHINDLFVLGVKDLEEDLTQESRPFLMQHLYRVQKLSSKFYEFRLAYNNQMQQTEAPTYIRINNFGDRKTGWLSHHPTKVRVSITGQLQRESLETSLKLSSMR